MTFIHHCVWKISSFIHHCVWKIPSFIHHCVWKIPSFVHHCVWKIPSFVHHCVWKIPSFIHHCGWREYFSTDVYKWDVVGKASSFSKRGFRNDAATAVRNNPSDWFHGRTINERKSWLRLHALHCYGNLKCPGLYTANGGEKLSCQVV